MLDLAHPTTQPGTLNRLEYVETTCRKPLEYGLRYAFSTSKPTHTPRQADTIVGVHELHLVIRRELPAHEQVLARLEAEVASLEDALRETKSRTRHEIERVASLVERGEEAERVSRLRVAYARECERRLTVATAEKIRLARALEALGGKDALETRRATRG